MHVDADGAVEGPGEQQGAVAVPSLTSIKFDIPASQGIPQTKATTVYWLPQL